MASSFLSALVIKKNNDVFISEDGVVGVTQVIPTPGSGGTPDGDFWAVPITDGGVFTGFNFEPTTPSDTTPPTVDSFHVFRLYNRQTSNEIYYARGTTTQYIAAAAEVECCVTITAPLPTTIPFIAGCQNMCFFDGAGKYFAVFGLPTLVGTNRYQPVGYYNNVALTAGVAGGYANTTTLLAFLNSGTWGAIGTWTFTNNVLKVTQTAGNGQNTLCAQITVVPPAS